MYQNSTVMYVTWNTLKIIEDSVPNLFIKVVIAYYSSYMSYNNHRTTDVCLFKFCDKVAYNCNLP